MNIIGTGLSGLIGSRIIELLSPKYVFTDLSRETGIDITDYPKIETIISASDAPWIFHLAAFTDVQAAEKERELQANGLSWKINVEATANLVKLSQKYHKKLLYIATDYDFDGTRKTPYTEEDKPNPQGWYAITKYEGEKKVLSMESQSLVIRISNPYRANPVGKRDFVHKMLDRLLNKQEIQGSVDQLFCPTFIDDIAAGIDILVSKNANGLYNLSGFPALSPFDAGKILAGIYGCPITLVREAKFADFTAGRAPIPQYAALSVAKINNIGVYPKNFTEGIKQMKAQENKQG